jgi:hypothetical protein
MSSSAFGQRSDSRLLTTVLTTTMTTVQHRGNPSYTRVRTASCLTTAPARAYGSEGLGVRESLRAHLRARSGQRRCLLAPAGPGMARCVRDTRSLRRCHALLMCGSKGQAVVRPAAQERVDLLTGAANRAAVVMNPSHGYSPSSCIGCRSMGHAAPVRRIARISSVSIASSSASGSPRGARPNCNRPKSSGIFRYRVGSPS